MPEAPVIQVQSLTKKYRDLVAVDHVTFEVHPGEILGFLGPNGAGKTTTMKIITGCLPATEGSAKIGGLDVFEHPLEVKRRIGYLPENPPVYNDMTVASYLKFVATIKGVPRAQIKNELERVSRLTSITDMQSRLIGNISKGYKQRVGLAQALLGDPEVLVLDEPTVGLDPAQIIEVRNLIRSLAGQHTIILSTHILQEVKAVCRKVLIIANGKVVAYDDLEALESKYKTPERVASLEEIFLTLTGEGTAALRAPAAAHVA